MKSDTFDALAKEWKVAPLAGAWIEIIKTKEINYIVKVAPLAGAWIEIGEVRENYPNGACRSSCRSVD